MGKAALTGLGDHKVITASRSGKGTDYQVDITSHESLRALFKNVGAFDAVVNAVGHCEYANFVDMTAEQWELTVQSKMLGQINVVKIGLEYINDRGSFTLISGIHNVKPIPGSIADATTSGAIDTFVQCVANELPRGIRINVVNPTVLEEAWMFTALCCQGSSQFRANWSEKRSSVLLTDLSTVKFSLSMPNCQSVCYSA